LGVWAVWRQKKGNAGTEAEKSKRHGEGGCVPREGGEAETGFNRGGLKPTWEGDLGVENKVSGESDAVKKNKLRVCRR